MRRPLRAAPGAGRGGAAAEQRCAVKGELANPSPRTMQSLPLGLLMIPRPSLVAGISSASRRLQLSLNDLPGAPLTNGQGGIVCGLSGWRSREDE